MRQSHFSVPIPIGVRSRYRALPFFCLALLISVTSMDANAARQYWVVVGSYQTSQLAEAERAEANALLGRDFDVLGADTPGDYVYRVAAGPFERSTANEFMQQAQQAHYEGSWLLPASAARGAVELARTEALAKSNSLAQSTPTQSTSTEPSSEFRSRPGRFDGRYDSGLERKSQEIPGSSIRADTRAGDAAMSIEPEPTRTLKTQPVEAPVLVQKPPSSYNLHRLRRDDGNGQ